MRKWVRPFVWSHRFVSFQLRHIGKKQKRIAGWAKIGDRCEVAGVRVGPAPGGAWSWSKGLVFKELRERSFAWSPRPGGPRRDANTAPRFPAALMGRTGVPRPHFGQGAKGTRIRLLGLGASMMASGSLLAVGRSGRSLSGGLWGGGAVIPPGVVKSFPA